MPIIDIRQKVLSGQIHLKKVAVWVESWGEWVMVQELNGRELSTFIDACAIKRGSNKGQVNLTVFYPHLAIASVRYPDATCEPEQLEVPVLDKNQEPVLDKNGEPVTKCVPHPHLSQYPSLEERQGNPLAGLLIFRREDDPAEPDLACRDAINETSSTALEAIGRVASRISALLPEDVFEKKAR